MFLVSNQDVFAWSPYEAPRVDPNFIFHRLNVDPRCLSKKLRPRRSLDVHTGVVKEEVDRLKEAGVIKEVFYPKWLANIVVVKKKHGKWLVCMDFTNLNKACPKGLFLVPKIDQLVDATFGHLRMSFLNAFQGYHKIALALKD